MAVIKLDFRPRCRLDLPMKTPAAALFVAGTRLMSVHDKGKAALREKRLERLIPLQALIYLLKQRPDRSEVEEIDRISDCIRARHLAVLFLPEKARFRLFQGVETSQPGQQHYEYTRQHGRRLNPWTRAAIANSMYMRFQAESLIGIPEQSAKNNLPLALSGRENALKTCFRNYPHLLP